MRTDQSLTLIPVKEQVQAKIEFPLPLQDFVIDPVMDLIKTC